MNVTITLDHAIRAQDALRDASRRFIRRYLDCRRKRALQGSARSAWSFARDYGASAVALRSAIDAELQRLGDPRVRPPPGGPGAA